MRITSDHIASPQSIQRSLRSESDLSDLCMLCGEQICFTYYIGEWLSQVSKNTKLTTYKGNQLQWRCHNDATILKVELWFQLWHCYADFEVVYIFELMTQPSENYSGAANPSEITTHFKVSTSRSTSDYLPPDSTFLKVTYIAWLEKITKQHKTYLYVTRTIRPMKLD